MRINSLFVGWIVFPLGDLIGQLIMGEFNLSRLFILALVGGLIYRVEIPFWFAKLESHWFEPQLRGLGRVVKPFLNENRKLNWLGKTIGAIIYFNPLWIARHVFFLSLAAINWSEFELFSQVRIALESGLYSFLINLPVALIGNYYVLVKTKPEHRFLGSAILSGLIVIIYAVEYRVFS